MAPATLTPRLAAKWAVIGLMKTLAMELGAQGIRANAILPGSVNGPRIDRVFADEAAAKGMTAQAVPLAAVRDRWLRPAVLAAVAVAAIGGLLAAWPAYQFPLMLTRVYQPWRDLPKPSFMRIKVIPDAIEIGRGEELVVQAEITGDPPWIVERLLRLTGIDMRRCLIEMDGEPVAKPGGYPVLAVGTGVRFVEQHQQRPAFIDSSGTPGGKPGGTPCGTSSAAVQ